MFEPIFELLPSQLRNKFERCFHRYEIDKTAGISRGVRIIYNDKRRKGKLKIGKNTYIGTNSILDITKSIIIGNNVQIAPNVLIFTHDSSKDRKNPIEKEVIIENNAYVGAGTIILCGVRIGKNVIIGAGAVVTKNVEADTVVSGVPARVVRER